MIAMQRNWKPVLIPNHRADNGNADEGQTNFHAAQFNGAPSTGDEDKLADIRFVIGAALALGSPALIGAGIYLAVTAVLRLS
jgi:hypothetical protein